MVPYSGISHAWVRSCLTSQESLIRDRCRKDGTTVASLDTTKLLQFEIPIPPEQEQARLVQLLDELLKTLDRGVKNAQHCQTQIASWHAIELARLVNSSGLELSTIGDEFSVAVGTTPSRADQGLWGGGVPWVASGEIQFNRISSTRETLTLEPARRGPRLHPAGTVMIAMIGEGRTRGQVAILDIEAAHNQNCASIRTAGSGRSPEYLYHYLRARYHENRRSGAGGVQPALNKAKVEAIRFPKMERADEDRIVERIDELDAQHDYTLKLIRQVVDRGIKLRARVTREAMRGRLADQDSTDEPAEILLSRIRAERGIASATAKKRRRSRIRKAIAQ